MNWCKIFTFLVWIPVLVFCDENGVEVTTTTGKIKGKIETVGTINVLSFLGIPFAEPPIADYRFKKPIPIKPWKDVLDARNKSFACMQGSNKDFEWIAKEEQNENCLTINVWIPKDFYTHSCVNATTSQLPVMVWIHGGGFLAGSANIKTYDGAVLAAYANVVVASMNYRLGAFGFMYAGILDAPGNMGLYDQQLALKWIKDNAKSFDGDPNKITIFGESVGGMSAIFHLISPKSKKLFRRAILESGSPPNFLFELPHDSIMQKNNEFANVLGCSNQNVNLTAHPEKVITCLRKVDAEVIAKTESAIFKDNLGSFFPIYGEDFLPKSLSESINAKDYNQTEILLGTNIDEGAIFLNYLMPENFTHQSATNLSVSQAKSVIKKFFQRSKKPTAEEIIDFYLGNLKSDDPKEILKTVHNTIGDSLCVCPAVFLSEILAQTNDVFYYLYTHKSSNTVWGDWIDVGHFEEVPFVFGAPLKSKSYTNEENEFSYNIMQMWASFAQYGRPLPIEEWPPYGNDGVYRELNPKSHKIGRKLRHKECEFWRKYE